MAVGLVAIVTSLLPAPTLAAASPPVLTQAVRWLRQDPGAFTGSYLTSYTSLALRGDHWSARGSLSWLSWDGDDSAAAPADASGPGAVYLTVGRRIWGDARRGSRSSEGWFRLTGKIPLQSGYSPIGSGEPDWGASLYALNRVEAFTILIEAGALNVGDPAGVSFGGLVSGSVSVSWHRVGAVLYPLVGLAGSTPVDDGEEPYLEWSGGVGARLSRRLSASVLYSHGLTSSSPEDGLGVAASLKL